MTEGTPLGTEKLSAEIGVILVDHGSTHHAANVQLEEVARQFREHSGAAIVEPAHMELAEPTLAQAFARCVAQGAKHIAVHPYFLAPGRHSTVDIPRMTLEAASAFPGVTVTVSEPLGADPEMNAIILRRINEALSAARDYERKY